MTIAMTAATIDDADDVNLRNEWFPTPDEFAAYQDDDANLAAGNLEVVLRNFGRPLTLRDLKDNCLHNGYTVDLALKYELGQGRIQETRGKVTTYTLVQ